MGYTIYWTEPNGSIVDKDELARIAEVILIAALDRCPSASIRYSEHDHTIGTLSISGGCETFILYSNTTSMSGMKNTTSCMRFVKTRELPYTSLVVTLLLYLFNNGLIESVSHDGEVEELVENVDSALYVSLAGADLDKDMTIGFLKKHYEDEENMTEEEVVFQFLMGKMNPTSTKEWI